MLMFFFFLLLRLRRSSSSGCWDHRNGWDSMTGAQESECLSPERDISFNGDGLTEDELYPVRRRTTPSRPTLFIDQPDLTPLIDTNFTSQPPSHLSTAPRAGFDFGGLVERAYMEHEPPSPSTYASPSSASSSPPSGAQLQRSPSLGEAATPVIQERSPMAGAQAAGDWESSVWAMELRGNLIAAGRSSGKLEVCKNFTCHSGKKKVILLIRWCLESLYNCIWLQLWDAVEGWLRCSNEDGVSGITALAFLNNRLNTHVL